MDNSSKCNGQPSEFNIMDNFSKVNIMDNPPRLNIMDNPPKFNIMDNSPKLNIMDNPPRFNPFKIHVMHSHPIYVMSSCTCNANAIA